MGADWFLARPQRARPAPATQPTSLLERTNRNDRASAYLGHTGSPTPTLVDLKRPASARGSELEVDERNRDAVTKDDVGQLDIVVTDNGPADGSANASFHVKSCASNVRAASWNRRSSLAIDAYAVSGWLQSG